MSGSEGYLHIFLEITRKTDRTPQTVPVRFFRERQKKMYPEIPDENIFVLFSFQAYLKVYGG
jgi:hypothetical protein